MQCVLWLKDEKGRGEFSEEILSGLTFLETRELFGK